MQFEETEQIEELWANSALLFVARTQKNFVLWFGLAFVLHVVSYWFRPAIFVGSIALMVVVYDLARAVRANQPSLYAFGTLIPIWSLLIFVALNHSATTILKEHGIDVGLFGIKPDALKQLAAAA
jgi:hypothetical protein